MGAVGFWKLQLLLDWIGQRADLFDFDGDGVAGLQPAGGIRTHADSVGRAGENDRAGGQGGAASEELNDLSDREDHVPSGPILDLCTVQNGADLEILGVGNFIGGDQGGTERAKSVESLAPTPLTSARMFLPIPGTDIVCAGIAEDMGKGFPGRNILAGATDHHRQLALVVHLVAAEMAGKQDGIPRVLERVDSFDEKDGVIGKRRLHLLRVASVVQADAEDLGGDDGREDFGDFRLPPGGLEPGEGITLACEGGAVGLQGSVMHAAANIAITDYLHTTIMSDSWPGKSRIGFDF